MYGTGAAPSKPPSEIILYNGVHFAPVHARMSTVLPYSTAEVWRIVGTFGKQALWMGSVEGQHIFTQLLGGQEQDYVGAVRVFGIADKLIFEQLTKLDHEDMIMCWQGISHPMNTNPFPASFLNFKASLQLSPVLIPGKQTFIDWQMDLMTEMHAVEYMRESMHGIMRFALLNLQQFLAAGGMPSTSLELAIQPPDQYGITDMPQPSSAPMLLRQHLYGHLAGTRGLAMQANATYMPPPMQQTAPLFSADHTGRMVARLEPTVPLFHEAIPLQDVGLGSLPSAMAATAGPLPPRFSSSSAQGYVVQKSVSDSAASAGSTGSQLWGLGIPDLSPASVAGILHTGLSGSVGRPPLRAGMAAERSQAPASTWHTAPQSVPGASAQMQVPQVRPHPVEEEPQALDSPNMRSQSMPSKQRMAQGDLPRTPSAAQLNSPDLRSKASAVIDTASEIHSAESALDNLSITDMPRVVRKKQHKE